MPAEPIDLREIDASFVALIVEETELDALRELGEEREVRPRSIEVGSERIGFAWPDLLCSIDFARRKLKRAS